MQLGMIGLGRMGANMVLRLMKCGHETVGYDLDPAAVTLLEHEGMSGAAGLQEMVDKLDRPRHIWIMVPAAFVGRTIDDLGPLLDEGDVLIDGGNSWYVDDIKRNTDVKERFNVDWVDVGTSGGVFGLDRGYCMMVGGAATPVKQLEPIFDALSPGVESADRTPGRNGKPTSAERGWLHCGPAGAGHFVKMVHNGIEYGLMAAYAEGMNILATANIGAADHPKDAETAPLVHPERYQFDFDIRDIAEVWRRGSVVASWLLDLTAEALTADPTLEGFGGVVSDSGEGRWTIAAAIDEGVPAPVLSAALYERFSSRGRALFADKILSAMRQQFGGHVEREPTSR